MAVLPKAHLTSLTRMSGSRCHTLMVILVIKTSLYSISVYLVTHLLFKSIYYSLYNNKVALYIITSIDSILLFFLQNCFKKSKSI